MTNTMTMYKVEDEGCPEDAVVQGLLRGRQVPQNALMARVAAAPERLVRAAEEGECSAHVPLEKKLVETNESQKDATDKSQKLSASKLP